MLNTIKTTKVSLFIFILILFMVNVYLISINLLDLFLLFFGIIFSYGWDGTIINSFTYLGILFLVSNVLTFVLLFICIVKLKQFTNLFFKYFLSAFVVQSLFYFSLYWILNINSDFSEGSGLNLFVVFPLSLVYMVFLIYIYYKGNVLFNNQQIND